jgi:hypothetical protein
VIPGITEELIRCYAGRFSRELLVVSTWSDSPAAGLERIEPLCDKLVLSDPPERGGAQNRNYQIVSTRAGLEWLGQVGARKVLKTRTDTLVTAPDVLDRCEVLQRLYPVGVGADFGARSRIVVSERYTLKNFPYFTSDILQFGDLQDLARYWSQPLDTRVFSPFDPEWRAKSYLEFARLRGNGEIFLTTGYLRALGWPADFGLEDHWRVLAELFIVQDERWFGHFFPKYGLYPIWDGPGQPGDLVDSAFWCRLQAGLWSEREAGWLDLERISFRNLFEGYLPPEAVRHPWGSA